jgi:hypothetical protein
MSYTELILGLVLVHGTWIKDVFRHRVFEYTAVLRNDVFYRMVIVRRQLFSCLSLHRLNQHDWHLSRTQQKATRIIKYSCRRSGREVPWDKWRSGLWEWMSTAGVQLDPYRFVVQRLRYVFNKIEGSKQSLVPWNCMWFDDVQRMSRRYSSPLQLRLRGHVEMRSEIERRLQMLEDQLRVWTDQEEENFSDSENNDQG